MKKNPSFRGEAGSIFISLSNSSREEQLSLILGAVHVQLDPLGNYPYLRDLNLSGLLALRLQAYRLYLPLSGGSKKLS